MQQIKIPGGNYCLLSDVAQLLLTQLPPLWYKATTLGRMLQPKDGDIRDRPKDTVCKEADLKCAKKNYEKSTVIKLSPVVTTSERALK